MSSRKLVTVGSSLILALQMVQPAFSDDIGSNGLKIGTVGFVSDAVVPANNKSQSFENLKKALGLDTDIAPFAGDAPQAASSVKIGLLPDVSIPAFAPSTVVNADNAPLLTRASALKVDPVFGQRTPKLALVDSPLVSGSVEVTTTVDNIDSQIVRKEIEFMKFNTDFRMHYAGGGPWKGRRLTAYNIVASSLAVAGLANLQAVMYHYRSNPGLGLAHRGRIESGLILVMLGYLAEAGGYSFEMLNDFAHDAKSVVRHWDAKSVRNRAAAFKAEIDRLLMQRAQLVNASGDEAVFTAEGRVLADWRDLAIVDFTDLYMQSRGNKHVRDVAELGTIAIATTGAFPGALSAIRGVQHGNLKQIGGSGVGFMVSAGLLTSATQIIKYGALVQNAHSQKEIDRIMGETKCHAANAMGKDLEMLNTTAMNASVSPSLQKRLKVYLLCKDLVVQRSGMMSHEKQIANNSYQEGVVSTLLRGGPQIAFSAMVLHAGYADTTHATAAFRVIAQAATVDTTSWSIWLLDAIQGGARAEIGNHKGRNGNSPSFSANYPILKNMESYL